MTVTTHQKPLNTFYAGLALLTLVWLKAFQSCFLIGGMTRLIIQPVSASRSF